MTLRPDSLRGERIVVNTEYIDGERIVHAAALFEIPTRHLPQGAGKAVELAVRAQGESFDEAVSALRAEMGLLRDLLATQYTEATDEIDEWLKGRDEEEDDG